VFLSLIVRAASVNLWPMLAAGTTVMQPAELIANIHCSWFVHNPILTVIRRLHIPCSCLKGHAKFMRRCNFRSTQPTFVSVVAVTETLRGRQLNANNCRVYNVFCLSDEVQCLHLYCVLANVNSRSRCYMSLSVRPSVVCLSVFCNVRGPYSGD